MIDLDRKHSQATADALLDITAAAGYSLVFVAEPVVFTEEGSTGSTDERQEVRFVAMVTGVHCYWFHLVCVILHSDEPSVGRTCRRFAGNMGAKSRDAYAKLPHLSSILV